MGCSISGLNALYDVVNGGGDVWINEHRFRILRQLGEGGFAYVFLVKEVLSESTAASGGGIAKKFKDPSHVSAYRIMLVINTSYDKLFSWDKEKYNPILLFIWIDANDGTYAMKKVLIQNSEQLDLVREEICVSSLFTHPNLLPLLDHVIIAVKSTQEGSWKHEAYLLFPVHLDGTLLDNAKAMKVKKEFFSTSDVLHIFRQLCAGLMHMHNFDPSYAHNDVKPGKITLEILTKEEEGGSVQLRGDTESLKYSSVLVPEWASEHCSAPFRAPELWDCPSHADIDERVDIWSLGCTLFAIMYGMSPFEYALGESGGSLQLAIVNAQIKWPTGPNPLYPDALHKFVTWMLQPQVTVRPHIDDIVIHVDKLISKFSH
ncbi:hypothetical protein TEA_015518 [Camellia sinensis var. sinensis]|uniref:non-specific serine/threonine protein kinase n=1 Tax=Camellia sinensis var. sinensis TaxID=542762 RepID=A0A4S4DYU9_CAMSN|nr:hypothetical protein TEA_015518 [Camellia sinensis var. sinensis]